LVAPAFLRVQRPRPLPGGGGRAEDCAACAGGPRERVCAQGTLFGAMFSGGQRTADPVYTPLLKAGTPNSTISSAAGVSNGSGTADVVQFASPVWYVKEDEKKISIRVIRIGKLVGPASVEYRTLDGSAKAGLKYENTKGTLKFEAGEIVKQFDVAVIDDDAFDTTVEFQVILEKSSNCALPYNGNVCRVLILDDDTFPSNDFEGAINEENAEEALHARGIPLLWSFIVFAWSHVPDIKKRSIMSMFLAQLGNFYYLLTIWLKIYLVDTVLNTKSPQDHLWIRWNPSETENRKMTALLLGAIYIAPNFILTGADYFEMRVLEMGFNIRRHLRVNLFRKYLNYTAESRREVPIQDLKTSMMEDIPDIVSNGYVILFELWRSFGKIFWVCAFLLKKHPKSAFPMLFYPTMMGAWLACRHRKRMSLLARQGDAESETQGWLIHASNGQQLIADYKQQGFVVRKFEEVLVKQRQLAMAIKSFEFFNELLVPWITILAVGIYMGFFASKVLDDDLKLGSYLATMSVYKDLGDRFEGVYSCWSSLSESIEPLVGLTIQLNLATELPNQKLVMEKRDRFSDEMMRQIPLDTKVSVYDQLPIGFKDVTVEHSPALRDTPHTIQAPQGNVVLVTGTHDLGKSTLLKILTDQIRPMQGQVFCPLHLRVLNVSHTPLLIQSMGLYRNLVFGKSTEDPGDVARVRGILRRLKLDKPWIMSELDKGLPIDQRSPRSQLAIKVHHRSEDEGTSSDEEYDETEKEDAGAEDESDDEWQTQLSESEIKRLHLARAFIYNPEVLIMHRPVDEFDNDMAQHVLGLMREFVDGRGVEVDAGDFELRRPRTLFFSAGNAARTGIADVVWRAGEHGVTAERGQRS